jgi:hypothetical protein
MSGSGGPLALAALEDAALLDAVQRQTLNFFWDGAHPASALARDRTGRTADPDGDLVATGGSGFGLLALIVAAERGWQPRAAVVARCARMLALLARATRHHGVFPHFLDGRSGATLPFSALDDGGDLVETGLLCLGLLCARQYFSRDTPAEARLRAGVTALWESVEWDWHTQGGQDVLYWHWSPRHGWAINQAIRGWNECLLTYVLAAAAPRHAIAPRVYHHGFAAGRDYRNGATYYGLTLPLGPAYGGPLFFSHYSFCGLDPRGLRDAHADYWQQCVRHVAINRAYCIDNPHGYRGYGEDCWGLTASDDPDGYAAHAPGNDNGTLAPTAAASSLPYAPADCLRALRHLLGVYGERLWGRHGFTDAFCVERGWYADTFLAIDQGPIIAMIENHRSGLLWRLFMSVPEVQQGLQRLGFESPWIRGVI